MMMHSAVEVLYFISAVLVMFWVFLKRIERDEWYYRVLFFCLLFSTSVVVFSALKPDELGSPMDLWKRTLYLCACIAYFTVDSGRIMLDRHERLTVRKQWLALKAKR